MQHNKRTIFIGDIHGCYDELQGLLQELQILPEDEIYCVGDVINKGPKSYETLNFLYQNKNQFHVVIGNHEVNFLDWLEGGSYGETTQFQKLKDEIDRHNAHHLITYLKSFPKYIETDDFLLIHGGLLPGKTPEQLSTDAIVNTRLINGKHWVEYYTGAKKIIYGHFAAKGFHIRNNTVGLDTGCVYGKRLSSYILETNEVFSQSALKPYSELKPYINIYNKKGKINKIKQYSNEKIAILGFGKEGKSTKKFLDAIGCKQVTILDEQRSKDYLDDLGEYKLIIKTPGISIYHPKIHPYKDKIISNTEIFFDNYKGKIIGVTGTKGKSTTSTLIYQTLKNAGYRVQIVGNIGNAVLDVINLCSKEDTYDYIIYELSSYSLEGFEPKCFIAILSNIFECHLSWHKDSFEIYKNAKFNIFKNAQNVLVGTAVNTQYDMKKIYPTIKSFGEGGDYDINQNTFLVENEKVFTCDKILLQGEHNKKNISSVIGVCDIIKKSKHNSPWVFHKLMQGLQETLSNFKGLPHRIQNIGTYHDITFIDDAIATTPESTIAALDTFKDTVSTIMLGGQITTRTFEELVKRLQKYDIKNIVLFPDSGCHIFGDFSKNLAFETVTTLEGYGHYQPKLFKTKSLKNAVNFAYEYTTPGKICILSNAAPSFSLWKSFTEKGMEFRKYVTNYQVTSKKKRT